MKKEVNIGVIQTSPEILDVEFNLSHAESLIRDAASSGAEIAVLPELFNVGFYFGQKLMEKAEPLDGKTVKFLKRISSELNICIITSFYEFYKEDYYNTMICILPDSTLQFYRKRNPTWQERGVWRRSDDPGPGIFETPYGRIGGAICFDSFSIETFNGFKENDVDLVVIIACWGHMNYNGWRPDMLLFRSIFSKWSRIAVEKLPRRYAEELHIPVVFVNQSGKTRTPSPVPPWYLFPIGEVDLILYGNSHVLDSGGEYIYAPEKTDVQLAEVVSIQVKVNQNSSVINLKDVPPDYLSWRYYFVQPPFLGKLFQKVLFTALRGVYNKSKAMIS